ncbi:MAG: orotate phosphoribosyltransferase [Spirochaetales bacterium]
MESVKSILAECDAMLTGHFLLSSGKHSSQYFQCARLLQYPKKACEVLSVPVKALLEEKKRGSIDFDYVIGPAMGGIIVAYELGRQLDIPAFFTERDDDSYMTLRRGFEIKKGQKILIAEDVITTGKSTLEAARCIEKLGGIITASVCVVDRRAENAENPFPWPIFSALRESAVAFDEQDCPLCKEGKIPPVKPGSRKI